MNRTVNCIIVDDEPVAREILESHLSKIDAVKIAGSCKSAVEAFNILSTKKIDLIFLDINMPSISGLVLAKTINKAIKVIFTTAYREYAVDGFDLQAVDYLLKPISFERLLQSINKYLDENMHLQSSTIEDFTPDKSEYFFVRSDRKMVKINFCDILFIESLADYVKIHMTDKTVVSRDTISNIEVKLPQKDFIRVHRSYIISLASIESFTNEYVEIGKRQIPVSRSYKKDVLKKLESN